MSLATVIRLEFAYPGVGVLAGDSLQYLSIATAHGVIMVFFMIMPAIFGGFGNFLLPTQLGVHDVAFPRLNSAAFWFIPGGLIMLCQLVCVDRRYQRMNCFNIRELQGILKRRFFTDLVNSNDHHDLLSDSMIGLRFKLNNSQSIEPDIFSFYNLGTTNSVKSKNVLLESVYTAPQNQMNLPQPVLNFVNSTSLVDPLMAVKSNTSIINLVYSLTDVFTNTHYSAVLNSINVISYIKSILSLNFNFTTTSYNVINLKPNQVNESTYINFSSSNLNTNDTVNTASMSENSSAGRFTRFSNLMVNYDYKCGHYLGI